MTPHDSKGTSTHVVYGERLNQDSLRLLTIEQGRDKSILCRLELHSFTSSLLYCALSYAWDEPQSNSVDTEPCILLNEVQICVKPNLYSALHELCAQQTNTYWWIDAICINQDDIVERTAQVSIMHQIYHSAQKVFVWLGPDPINEAYLVREFLRALLAKYMDIELDKFRHQWLKRDADHAFLEAGLPSLTGTTWAAVVRFWDRAWFSRVWVHQEAAVAEEVEIWCGQIEYTLIELIEASRFMEMSGLGEALMTLKSEKPTKSISGRMIGCHAIGIEALRLLVNGIQHLEADDDMVLADRLTGTASEQKHPLLRKFATSLYLTFRDDATDDRDKVFVILMLMKQAAESYCVPELPIQVDYSKNVSEVYHEVTSWVISESGCLGMLCLLFSNRSWPTVGGLSSWVPDYSKPPLQALRLFQPGAWCNANVTQEFHSKLKPSLDGHNLYVHAKYCGTVADVGDTYESMIDDGCFELTARVLLNCPMIMGNGLTRLDAWRMTMSGNRDVPTASHEALKRSEFQRWLVFFALRKMIEDFTEGLIKYPREILARMPSFELLAETDDTKTVPDWGFWQNTLSDRVKTRHYLEHTPSFETIEIIGRRLFRTTDPIYLGYAPDNTQPGDEIWLAASSTFPLVLRKAALTSPVSAQDASHHVIGEAYTGDYDSLLSKLTSQDWQRLVLR